jgi:beta-lactamase regulating signal transducer with metallopeptidase domain/protocatechuate 3,4-dioxygenase beta subunit
MSAIEIVNTCADLWANFMLVGLVEGTVALLLVGLLWVVVRRRASAQLGYCLFLLVPLKLLFALPLPVPANAAFLSPQHAAGQLAGWVRSNGGETTSRAGFVSDESFTETADVSAAAVGGTPSPPEQRPEASTQPLSAPAALPPSAPTVQALPSAGITLSGTAFLFIVWLATTVTLFSRFLHTQWQTHRLLRQAMRVGKAELPVDIEQLRRLAGVRQPVRVIQSTAVASPAVWGLWRPCLIFPANLVGDLTPRQITWVVLHELAHIRRHDLLVALVQRVVQILYVFHPAVWVANWLIDEQREYACDDLAIATSCLPRRDCGEGFLLVVEKAHSLHIPALPALGLFRPKTLIRRRLMRILDKNRPAREGLSRISAVFLLALAVILLPRVQAQDKKPAPPTETNRTGKPLPEALKHDPETSVVFSGRVLDPDGKTVKSASLYVTVKSAMQRSPKLKDPQTKLFEQVEVDGKKMIKVVHPRLIEVFKRFGLDLVQPASREIEEKIQGNLALSAELQKVMADLHEDHPYLYPRVQALSGPDGRFRFSVAQDLLKSPYHEDVDVLAVAEGFGLGWTWTNKDVFTDMTVRLTRDVPINGRLLDLQGKPIAGAKVRLGPIMVAIDGTIEPWGEMLESYSNGENAKGNELMRQIFSKQLIYSHLDVLPKIVKTDMDGHFSIRGIGAERLAFNLEVSGTGIGSDHFSVITRPGPGIKPKGRIPTREEYRTYGATFDHVVKPVRVVEGTIRDMGTGKPLAGVQVYAWGPVYTDSFTNKDGKYRLSSLAKAQEVEINVGPWGRDQLPYLNVAKRVVDTPGLDTLTVDFDLVRGVVLSGRVTDKATGKPVARARVAYATFADNPHLAGFAVRGKRETSKLPELMHAQATTGPDGSFSLVVLPGPCLLGVQVPDSPYATAEFPEADKDPTIWDKVVPYIGRTAEFQAVNLITVSEKATKATCDLTLVPGRAIPGMIIGPDGKPLSGVRVIGLTTSDFSASAPLKSAGFTVTGLTPRRPRLLGFYQKEQQLGAQLLVRSDDKGPLTVRLQKCGTLTGRLLDADKNPRTSIRLRARAESPSWTPATSEISATTDKDGRFRMDGMIPDVSYSVFTYEGPGNILVRVVSRAVKLASGETKDLGDVVTKKD